jgi:DNA polymerase-3 subunit delta
VKITASRAEAFLGRLEPAVVAVLLYGPDSGLVRERAERLAKSLIGEASDPFRLVELSASAVNADPARVSDEAAAIPFTGGPRVVRVRGAGDTVFPALEGFLDHPPPGGGGAALVLVEAGDLGPRSPLRRLFEGAGNAAAVPCYSDEGAALARFITKALSDQRVKLAREALDYLVANLGGDRMVTRQELGKLALYAGDGGEIGIEDAMLSVGDSSALTLDDVAFAACGGDVAALEKGLERVFLEGVAPVRVLRAVARHLQRLHLVAARRAAGDRAEDAMAALRPPVFFKSKPAFRAQIALWPPARAAEALSLVTHAEIDAKRTGMPAELLCRHALMTVAERAARAGQSP